MGIRDTLPLLRQRCLELSSRLHHIYSVRMETKSQEVNSPKVSYSDQFQLYFLKTNFCAFWRIKIQFPTHYTFLIPYVF